MELHIHHHFDFGPRLEELFDSFNKRIHHMTVQLDTLTAQVATNKDGIASAITLLGNIKTALDAAIASNPNDDGAALQALSDSLGADDQALAAAVVANTPAAPAQPASGQSAAAAASAARRL